MWAGRLDAAAALGSTAGRGADRARWDRPILDVPGADPSMAGQLEATFDPGCCRGGNGTFRRSTPRRTSGAGGPSRSSGFARVAAGAAAWAAADGAHAPRRGRASAIGSTPVMDQLRDTIRHVAADQVRSPLTGRRVGVGEGLAVGAANPRLEPSPQRCRSSPSTAPRWSIRSLEAELFGIEESHRRTGVRRPTREVRGGGRRHAVSRRSVGPVARPAQAKVLRVIQDLAVERVGGNGTRRVDIRIVAATNRRLVAMVERQLFRVGSVLSIERRRHPRAGAARERRRQDILELHHFLASRARFPRLRDAAHPHRIRLARQRPNANATRGGRHRALDVMARGSAADGQRLRRAPARAGTTPSEPGPLATSGSSSNGSTATNAKRVRAGSATTRCRRSLADAEAALVEDRHQEDASRRLTPTRDMAPA